ncbi:hypothetical protein B4U80_14234 [Leptotrombidium deliense]|uniref:ATPase AAA-type core domain-containing protein n=1 Tax=Leptotrombidium deliense TaxID=299467 RepID=A0A443RZK1_9ACAR|nr:hypothetical protein B4U80_14234 [Leptotrombidium deliense]
MLLLERYKPKLLKQVIGDNHQKIIKWLRAWNSVICKAALVSGPTGVGKTLIVRLVFEDLGYSILELNASDIRTKKVLTEFFEKIKNINDQSLINFHKKSQLPCKKQPHVALIIDELDDGISDYGGLAQGKHRNTREIYLQFNRK